MINLCKTVNFEINYLRTGRISKEIDFGLCYKKNLVELLVVDKNNMSDLLDEGLKNNVIFK